jgi:ABC-type Zn uptake system ZnuABC Zn-binding protein ZnuA
LGLQINVIKLLGVVASFSILGDWVKEPGGDKVDVTSLVEKDEDAHVYKATPQDMALLSNAELFVVNGLGLEGWMNRIIDASGYSGTTLVASKGIDVIMQQTDEHGHSHQDHDAHSAVDGVADPHAWTSLRQAIYYLENISSELVRLRPDSSAYFEDRKATYIDQIKQLDARAMALFSGLEDARKNIVIPHSSFAYLAKDYGLSV